MGVTIKDIAAKAGVSVPTVSKYMNGYTDISEETRERIKEAVQELNYVPSTFARAVANKSTKLIGLTIPDIRDSYFAQSASGIEQTVEKRGYQLIYGNLDRRPDKFLGFLRRAQEMRFDGMIITPDLWTPEVVTAIGKLDFPIVALRRRPPKELSIPFIDSNHYRSATIMMDYLYSQGHRRIGHIILPTAIGEERTRAYRDFCRNYGMDDRAVKVDAPANILSDAVVNGEHCCEILMNAFPDTTAIFGGSDQLAIGAMSYLNRIGKSVPGDISVVGVGNMEYSSLPWFNLTTMELKRFDMGISAANMLLGLVEHTISEPSDLLFDAELVVRGSTAVIPV